jgi:hypothetical protein
LLLFKKAWLKKDPARTIRPAIKKARLFLSWSDMYSGFRHFYLPDPMAMGSLLHGSE